jgi:aminoglycoside phosphotransferase (APT) family kinase protein
VSDAPPAAGGSSGEAPGPLIARGRAADVFDLGDGTVLRRYRSADRDVEYEARVMRHVAAEGIRVPAVVDAEGTDLVMERIDGPTMLEDLLQRRWMLLVHARRLARMQQRLAELSAPGWMLAPGSPPGERSVVLHLDLHPMNVILGPQGPVLIDWTNAAGGPAGFDAALSYVEISTYVPDAPPDAAGPDGTGAVGDAERLGQRVFASTFRRARGRRVVDAFLVAACDHRLADRGTTPAERIAVGALRKRALARRPR